MKLDPIILLAVAVGIIFGFLVGGWNGSPFGRMARSNSLKANHREDIAQ